MMQTDLFQETTSSSELHLESVSPVQITFVSKTEITGLDFSFQTTPFGEIIVASCEKGISWLAFSSSRIEGITDMTIAFPNVKLNEKAKGLHKAARKVISGKTSKKEIKLCVVASDFQQEVWRELLKIPFGKTTSYGEIASNLSQPVGASRAVGTAIGKNPVAFLIPCHRVIQLSGKLGGYRWGIDRKKSILGFERNR